MSPILHRSTVYLATLLTFGFTPAYSEIMIGASYPETGDYKNLSRPVREGIEKAVKDWNINGSASVDTLDGGTGADQMTGGPGGNRYYVDNVGDVIVKGSGLGYDLDQVVDDELALAVDAPGSEPSGVTPQEPSGVTPPRISSSKTPPRISSSKTPPRISSSMAALSLPGGVSPVPMPFRGVNLSGAEFGGSHLPGNEGTDYTWPTTDEVDYFMSKGMNTFRVNFLWERLQPTANGPLAPAYAAKLESLVNYITSSGRLK
jgi:hypothetical protein